MIYLRVEPMIQEKTHNVRQNPGMSANRLADYMAASEQTRRSILKSCKYMSRARVIQHNDAKESIARYVSSPDSTVADLEARMEILRNGLQGSDFDNEVAEHNADYIERFLENPPALPARVQEVSLAGKMPSLDINGFHLTFSPNLILRRVNMRNTPKIGVAFFRYAKNKVLSGDVADWQGAISFGYLDTKVKQGAGDVDPEKEMCVAIDMWTGKVHTAPSNAVYRFNEIKAACAGIVERWGQIQPPDGAVL
ncbi:MAG: hypothetical protein B7X90_08670 [Novosphingobium sp. 17-62-19]|nr:MAG: hypothetical protein B7Y74_00115 [Novosphingobium sp. 35-62-5]OZA19466.1 MAG: hypothetical protein B7X90_08670 [Novosphingobium sp. 17-62-19]